MNVTDPCVAVQGQLVPGHDGLSDDPIAQRTMAKRSGAKVTEVPGSHVIYRSHPEAVSEIIMDAGAAL